MRNVVICFDGTWNTPDNKDGDSLAPTNVAALHRQLVDDGERQTAWYDPGVGTQTWRDRLLGGATGWGLSGNVQQGYAELARRWREGDRIFIFGFSRGAYTARSLGGLLRKCWLPRDPTAATVEKAYDFYRRRDATPDAPDVKAFREATGRRVDVHCIGVWDTVGSLGIPGGLFTGLNNRYWGFHDTQLSAIVKHAFHAVAIDEHRAQFAPTLWDDVAKPGQVIEQRWFVGAHGNVGGGYREARLSLLSLAWMASRCAQIGLLLKEPVRLGGAEHLGDIRDSWREFLGWYYRLISRRHLRAIPAYQHTGMSVDGSAWRRRGELGPGYDPVNLHEPADRAARQLSDAGDRSTPA